MDRRRAGGGGGGGAGHRDRQDRRHDRNHQGGGGGGGGGAGHHGDHQDRFGHRPKDQHHRDRLGWGGGGSDHHHDRHDHWGGGGGGSGDKHKKNKISWDTSDHGGGGGGGGSSRGAGDSGKKQHDNKNMFDAVGYAGYCGAGQFNTPMEKGMGVGYYKADRKKERTLSRGTSHEEAEEAEHKEFSKKDGHKFGGGTDLFMIEPSPSPSPSPQPPPRATPSAPPEPEVVTVVKEVPADTEEALGKILKEDPPFIDDSDAADSDAADSDADSDGTAHLYELARDENEAEGGRFYEEPGKTTTPIGGVAVAEAAHPEVPVVITTPPPAEAPNHVAENDSKEKDKPKKKEDKKKKKKKKKKGKQKKKKKKSEVPASDRRKRDHWELRMEMTPLRRILIASAVLTALGIFLVIFGGIVSWGHAAPHPTLFVGFGLLLAGLLVGLAAAVYRHRRRRRGTFSPNTAEEARPLATETDRKDDSAAAGGATRDVEAAGV